MGIHLQGINFDVNYCTTRVFRQYDQKIKLYHLHCVQCTETTTTTREPFLPEEFLLRRATFAVYPYKLLIFVSITDTLNGTTSEPIKPIQNSRSRYFARGESRSFTYHIRILAGERRPPAVLLLCVRPAAGKRKREIRRRLYEAFSITVLFAVPALLFSGKRLRERRFWITLSPPPPWALKLQTTSLVQSTTTIRLVEKCPSCTRGHSA